MHKFLILALIILPALLSAAYLENIPTTVTQPDGTVLELLASGDEFFNYLHDANGYTIIQSQTDGYYYYAAQDRENLIPSAWKAGTVNPHSKNLTPNLRISEAEYKARASFMQHDPKPEVRTPQTGTVNNLCILIRFSDQTEFDTPRFVFDDKFNAVGETAYSQRNYYQKVSYDQLDIITGIYPSSPPDINVSYVDSHPRAYFMPYNAITNPIGYNDSWQRTEREHTLLANAVAFVASQIPSSVNLDADNDGYVDNVCFIIRGPHTAWADLLWAHRWVLYGANSFINGKRVWDFTFQPENQNEVNVLCHEMFHSIGAPDLYHYTFNGVSPAGVWDIMEAGKGHMGAYMKYKYGGWLPAPTVISAAGTYAVNPVTSNTNSFYRINPSSASSEYFVLEYRKQGSDLFEQYIPDSGLLIYRINPSLDGNADGPPDEVYVMRPNGTLTINGDIAHAAFSIDKGRTEFNNSTNPAAVTYNGSAANISIYHIGSCGESISFDFAPGNTVLPPAITINYPADGAILTLGEFVFNVNVTPMSGTLAGGNIFLDGEFLGSYTESPTLVDWTAGVNDTGWHELKVTANNSNGLSSTRIRGFRVIDPMLENWFNWTTDTPAYSSFGRGSIPIQTAIDLDLGTEDYVVKQIAFHIEDDPFGDPAIPGKVSAKINRFANGLITGQILLDLGDFIIPAGTHYETAVSDSTVISGQIALIVNLYEYQNIVFDDNGVTGHSWLTEPDRPWTDAQGRGMLGAADIGLKLQSPYVGNEDNFINPTVNQLSVYPNPFRTQATIGFNLSKDSEVSLAVFNLKGQKVHTLFNGNKSKGSHTQVWKGISDTGQAVSNGVYFIRLTQHGQPAAVRKVILMK